MASANKKFYISVNTNKPGKLFFKVIKKTNPSASISVIKFDHQKLENENIFT